MSDIRACPVGVGVSGGQDFCADKWDSWLGCRGDTGYTLPAVACELHGGAVHGGLPAGTLK